MHLSIFKIHFQLRAVQIEHSFNYFNLSQDMAIAKAMLN